MDEQLELNIQVLQTCSIQLGKKGLVLAKIFDQRIDWMPRSDTLVLLRLIFRKKIMSRVKWPQDEALVDGIILTERFLALLNVKDLCL